MVAQILPNTAILELRNAAKDELSQTLFNRMIAVMQPLKDVRNPRHLRRVLSEVVLAFFPVVSIIGGRLLAIGTMPGETSTQTQENLIAEVWSGLASQGEIPIDQSDRQAILSYMKLQMELAELSDQVPTINQPALYIAVAEAFWVLRKMDLCFMAIVAIGYKDIVPQDRRLAHWLCLAIKGYLKEWQSALFANDPVLRERLTRPVDSMGTISTEEMERRLGL